MSKILPVSNLLSPAQLSEMITNHFADGKTINGFYVTSWHNIETDQVFFTDRYRLPEELKHLQNDFIPSSMMLPLHVVPRKDLPSGVIKTFDDFIKIFHKSSTLFISMEHVHEYYPNSPTELHVIESTHDYKSLLSSTASSPNHPKSIFPCYSLRSALAFVKSMQEISTNGWTVYDYFTGRVVDLSKLTTY